MILSLLVCGKCKPGPETDLLRDYLSRAKKAGRSLGVSDVLCREISPKTGTSNQQIGALALRASSADTRRIVLDETGKQMTSQQLAKTLNQWREQGVAEICLLVGPADGWSADVRRQADIMLGFGKLTWPHKLAQIMAAEQIYRAISILVGSPYHREGSK
ncbi:LSU m3Psi1915 methyltransferase RlmH [hydrothermal vent metagenome]|uniref:LSU m3Psi1915 methyltransferase RlmH n=1 Tax=hydrothermal vent metagenome TaxID=652676 RepID=A0A3B0RF14_9ZZZZ